MDVDDEWELLSDEGFLQINDDGAAAKQLYSHRPSTSLVFHMNYFICPPPSNQTTLPNPNHPLPIDLPPPAELKMESCDQDPVLQQVFFKKMRDAEFVDMKVDSPKPSAVVPQIEASFQFEEEEEEKGEIDSEQREVGLDLEGGGGGANVWKWSLNGIGAICSFGVAVATFCIIVFTNTATANNNKHHHHHNQKLHFRIYSDDKRMKAVLVSGAHITRARITVGGYYNGSV